MIWSLVDGIVPVGEVAVGLVGRDPDHLHLKTVEGLGEFMR